MPVPTTETARLKARIDLAAYIRSRGVELKSVGASLKGLCPFHAEKTPSFIVTPSKGLFHCFGCGAGGDVIRFVERFDKVSFPGAVEILAGHARTPSTSSLLPVEGPGVVAMNHMNNQTDSSEVDILDPSLQQVMRYALEYYEETLRRTPDAIGYLESRGLIHPELISTFRVGFSDGSLLDVLPGFATKEGLGFRKKLTQCGILRLKKHYIELMRGRIVIPFIDESGNIRQLYGRKIASMGSTAPDHLYLPLTKNCPFHPQAFLAETLILCEGPLDALSFFCAGLPNVSCTTSAGDIQPALLDAIDNGNTRRVLIAFDDDNAGNAGAQKLSAILKERGIDCVRVQFPYKRSAGRSSHEGEKA